jgi:acetylserotonin N-methyltransferase
MQPNLTLAPSTDPTPIYRHRDALYASDMLIAALKELDLFSYLATQPQSLQTICQHFNIQPRPADVMTTLFVASGWLERDNNLFALTPAAREHLVQTSPWFIGPYFPPAKDRPIALDLLQCLQTGQPANFASRKNHDDWHKAMETESFAREFTAMMDCRGILLAQALSQTLPLQNHHRLLDVAGGSGVYSCSLCSHFPNLSATVLEKAPVDQIAAQAINSRNLSHRIQTTALNMLTDPWPRDHDVHLLSNVLHDWDVPVVQQILHASSQTLPTNGLLIVHDTFLNPDKSGPLHVAEYSVLLMHVTQGRCYSESEITEWAAEASFTPINHVPSAANRSALLFQKQ